jgi:light-regulated signal transduction histidine kinase (bacteriophytochrome)
MCSELGRGNLEHRLSVKSHDELGILALTFNDMTEELAEQNKQLKEEKQKVLDNIRELEKYREHLEELVKERTGKLEESRTELDVLNKQLQAANKELEAFAYSVSHDLRAPLRNIDGFSQILLEDYSDILDKQGQHYLQRVRAGTQNMGQLIDDILSLSRSGRHHMDKKTINMDPIVREVCKSLENELKDRKVDFTVHECPPALADSHLVKIVFTNLLSNALKFTRIHENAKIEIGSMTEDGHTVFFIKDNGAGFDMKYADKLFVPFQRLHRAEEYEGSGIGLAIVQRIIHRHGGRIWAESEIDVGTTFYFTL